MAKTLAELQSELSEARERLSYCLDAEARIMRGGQTFIFDEGDMHRSVTRADIGAIADRIAYWKREIRFLEEQIYRNGIESRRYLTVG